MLRRPRLGWLAMALGTLPSLACETPEDTAPNQCPIAITVEPCGACVASRCPGEAAACLGDAWQSGQFAGACAELLECACGDETGGDCARARTDACRECEVTFAACQSGQCEAECGVNGGFAPSGGVGGSTGIGGTTGLGGTSGIGGIGGVGGIGGIGGTGGLGGVGGLGGEAGLGGSSGLGGAGGLSGSGGVTSTGGFGGLGGAGGSSGEGGLGGSFSCAPSGGYCIGDGDCCSGLCSASVCT